MTLEQIIKERFEYNPKTGDLIYKIDIGKKIKSGDIAGSIGNHGYRRVGITVDGKHKSLLSHRVCWFLHYGKWPKEQLDHINGIKTDNRVENLREVSNAENGRSFKTPYKNVSSVYRGVCWHRRHNKWTTQIIFEGKKYHLGYYNSEKEAAKVYNTKAAEFGFNEESFNVIG